MWGVLGEASHGFISFLEELQEVGIDLSTSDMQVAKDQVYSSIVLVATDLETAKSRKISGEFRDEDRWSDDEDSEDDEEGHECGVSSILAPCYYPPGSYQEYGVDKQVNLKVSLSYRLIQNEDSVTVFPECVQLEGEEWNRMDSDECDAFPVLTSFFI